MIQLPARQHTETSVSALTNWLNPERLSSRYRFTIPALEVMALRDLRG